MADGRELTLNPCPCWSGRRFPAPSLCSCFRSLRDTLVSYLETKGSDVLPDVESQLPADIQLSSCVPVWAAAAQLKRDRQLR